MKSARAALNPRNVTRHFSESIWVRDTDQTPTIVRLWNGMCRLFFLVGFGFIKDQCIIRAAALTFTTILSIVPFLAVAFSISKGFGLQNTDKMREWVLAMTAGRPEVADKIIEYIDRTNVQALGWVGVATLLFTVFSLVGTIEKAFNTIWGVKKGRSAWRKVTDFFPVIVFGPLILLIASSFNVTLQQQQIVTTLLSVEAIGVLEAAFLKLTPYLLIMAAFALMYGFIPHARVKIGAAALGGAVGGILWQLAQWGYITWQIGAAKYNAIYGSFAQLPVLLIWIYISWTIVLLGSEVSYAWQNINSFVKQRFFGHATPVERQKLATLMMIVLAKRFKDGKRLPSVEELSDAFMAPTGLISELFTLLSKAGYIVQTDAEDCESYAPAKTLDDVRVVDIVKAINSEGLSREHDDFSQKFAFVDTLFESIDAAARSSEANSTLMECAEKYPAYVLDVPLNEDSRQQCPAEQD